jgi:hypothetical protein
VRKTITIGIVAVMVLMGFVVLANPIASEPTGTINKSMDDTNLWLGDYVIITIDVTISGGTLKVSDELPEYLSYIEDSFTVNGNPVTPTIKKGCISTMLGPGTYTIVFVVIYDSAPPKGFQAKNTAYLMDGSCIVDEDSVIYWVAEYCGFHKGFEIISGDDGDGKIEVGEDIHWAFWITVKNLNLGYTMTNVMVWDRFGAEIEIDDGPYITKTSVDIKLKGNSKKIMLKWTIGDLVPDEEARLDMEVSTDKNPAGHQEYTSPGCYEWNSGATLKFRNDDGIQLSAHTGSLYVKVYEAD